MPQFSLKSVLLVDDDPAATFINKVFIRNLPLDVEVYSVGDGKEALDLLDEISISLNGEQAFVPCLLILDIKMPVMDGWEFLDAYTHRYSEEIKNNITIVVTTMSEDERDIIRASNNPMIKEFVQKPLSDEKLLEIVETHFMVNQH
ncbi:response regulator [Flavobacteriaceae bacterium KMM 6897]|nr:response regulator [Flavobacteriaceae bacterium KMM 6897]MEB8345342.1 response regulator [Flavobacteriaceae bacterium KMM 6898]